MDSKVNNEILSKTIFLLFCSYSKSTSTTKMRYICEVRFEYPFHHEQFNEKKYTKHDRVIDTETN